MREQIRRTLLGLFIGILPSYFATAQEIPMTEEASAEQVYEESYSSEELLPMNDMGMDTGGYVLYQTEITTDGDDVTLEVENVRDYAIVYLDKKRIGELNNEKREITFGATEGTHILYLYVENIGRITYGPEILDNSKGLFGSAELNGEALTNWTMTPLAVREYNVNQLNFTTPLSNGLPRYFRGTFQAEPKEGVYLDTSGWGMGEVWLNGEYVGAYWEQNSQQSLPIPSTLLKNGENVLIVFELKDNGKQSMQLTDKPIFK